MNKFEFRKFLQITQKKMGVKTKEFGKFGWAVLEGLAQAFDCAETGNLSFLHTTAHIFNLFGFILPCVFCRVSYREFLDNAEIMHMLKNREARKLVYNLHERVNEKLYQQKIANHERRERLEFVDVRYTEFKSFRFWEALLIFLGYVMCDYQESEASKIEMFLYAVADFANVVDPEFGFDVPKNVSFQTLKKRLNFVWEMFQSIAKKHNWKFEFSEARFHKICESGIVAKCIK